MDEHFDLLYTNLFVLAGLPVAIIFVFIFHELGHYIAARCMGMEVTNITVGLGKKIWSKTDRRGTVWHLRLFPLRAHVHIADYHPEAGEKLWRRLFVVLAGSLANFILPFFLIFAFLLIWGKPVIPTIITGAEPGMPVYEAGMRAGDKIVAIQDKPVASMYEIKELTKDVRGEYINITFERKGNTHNLQVMPYWANYKDINGVERSHSVLGFLTIQAPLSFRWVASVGGVNARDENHARELIKKHLGSITTFGLNSHDRHVHVQEIYLNEHLNKHLYDPEHKDYGYFFIGNMGDNIYLRLSVLEALGEASLRSGRLVINILKLPFNLFPIDREWVTVGAKVSHRSSPIGRNLYVLIFITSLFSVFIGWLNLIPLPGLDGGEVLVSTAETFSKKGLTNKNKAMLFVISIFVLYGSIFIVNAFSLYEYFEFLIEDGP